MENQADDVRKREAEATDASLLRKLKWIAVVGDTIILFRLILSVFRASTFDWDFCALSAGCGAAVLTILLIVRSQKLQFRNLLYAVAVVGNIVAAAIAIFFVTIEFPLFGTFLDREKVMLGMGEPIFFCVIVFLNLYLLFRKRPGQKIETKIKAGEETFGQGKTTRAKIIAALRIAAPLLLVVAYFCAGPIAHVFIGRDWQEDNLFSHMFDFTVLIFCLSVAIVFFWARNNLPMALSCFCTASITFFLAFYVPAETHDAVIRDLVVAKIFLFHDQFKTCVAKASDIPGEGKFSLCDEHTFDAPDPFGSFDEAIVYDTTGKIAFSFSSFDTNTSNINQSQVWKEIVFKVFPNITGDGSYGVHHLYGDFYYVVK